MCDCDDVEGRLKQAEREHSGMTHRHAICVRSELKFYDISAGSENGMRVSQFFLLFHAAFMFTVYTLFTFFGNFTHQHITGEIASNFFLVHFSFAAIFRLC